MSLRAETLIMKGRIAGLVRCYANRGTEIAYGAGRQVHLRAAMSGTLSAYAHAMRCPVWRSCMVLLKWRLVRCQPTRMLCDVRYCHNVCSPQNSVWNATSLH
eukprot:2646436-Rhodomonas_salina.1